MRVRDDTIMRAVILRPPAKMLEERRRTGADRFDEVWEGVLHMVPPPSSWHQRFGTQLLFILKPIADAQGLESSYETGIFRPGTDDDYRVPDLVFARTDQISKRGVDGKAELVVELLSEGDESREKLGFYEQLGVSEVLLIDPETRDFELYVLRGDRLHIALPDEQGAVRSQALGVTLAKAAGPRLTLDWSGGRAEV